MISRTRNVLIVLSPLSLAFLRAEAAIDAACDLKQKGAVRADLTMDPRLKVGVVRHLNAWPVPDFTHAARTLSQSIFAPVVGHSDIQDFSHAVGKYERQQMPDLSTLSNVGALFAHAKDGGHYLGLALYAALHGKSSDRKPYTHLLYPEMTPHARHVLDRRLGGRCEGDADAPSYGVLIDLTSVREHIGILTSPGAMNPTNRLQ